MSRSQQKPPCKDDDEAIKSVSRKEKKDTPQNYQVGKDLADKRRDIGGRLEVTSGFPDDWTQDSPTIKGESGNQVEDAKNDVHQGQVREDRDNQRMRASY